MKQKTIMFLMGIFALTFTVSQYLSFAVAEPINLNYANFMPADTFPSVQMERWKAEVEKQTSGKVIINTFPGSKLLGARDMMDGVLAGKADIGCLCMPYEHDRFLLTNATALPLGIPNSRTGSLVLWNLYEKYKPEAFAKVKVLTMFTTSPANIMSKKPVKTIEDVRGMTLRASGEAGEIVRTWGANLVNIPMPETPDALKKGDAEGVFSSLDVMKNMNLAQYCRFVAMTDTVIYPLAVVMNLDRWNSLPPDVQKIMNDLGPEHAKWTGSYVDNYVQEAVAWSKEKYKVEFFEFEKSYKAKFNYLLWPLTSRWIKNAEAKGLPGKAIVTDIRTFIRTYR
ncbi:TRAP transporter substrate-binding protein [Desulfonema magnum]|uniref:C4-TRAP dicarboxylate transporter periplasmic binding protein, DctP-like n=1 Tax=Desulfonema magnum TaxID=45655 RepID=A0A975GKQ2_9BACT|nr:TRAP transporter substrate-binding protein [Desulfonema magnum]QTA84986.1 Putative C4-TRAP dicarboxylate transporter periplasmic binding protein, DctP-like [Desulfonema magnum]